MLRFFEKLNTLWAFIAVLVLVLAVDGFLFFYGYQPSLEPARDAAANPPNAEVDGSPEATTAEEATVAKADASSGQEASKLRVTVSIVGAPSWLRVQEDGQTVLDQQNPSGFSRRFEAAQEVRIRTWNARATRVEANGRDVGPLGASGEAGTWTFKLSPKR